MTRSESRGLVAVSLVLLLSAAFRVGVEARHRHQVPENTASVLDTLLRSSEAALADQQRRQTPLAPGERISVARAEAWEFDRLPGVGSAMADSIVALRARAGVLRHPSDLLAVRGIGPTTVDRLRPFLEERDPPEAAGGRGADHGRMDVNSATARDLEALPGVGPALASRILERRRIRGPFTSLDELREVKGIGPVLLARLKPLLHVGG